MKVEIIGIGTKLLVSDILDTNTAYLSRSLREAGIYLTCKVTVGEESEMIANVLQTAVERADIVITTGGIDDDITLTRKTAEEILGSKLRFKTQLGGENQAQKSGFLIESSKRTFICLPGNRREMSYLFETKVLPYIQHRLSSKLKSGCLLLRTVDIMESDLKQQLSDLVLTSNNRITYDSYAGQTNIQLWVEADSFKQTRSELEDLKQKVYVRLGDHIYGQEEDRLEDIVLQMVHKRGMKIVISECNTNQELTAALIPSPNSSNNMVTKPPVSSYNELVDYLSIEAAPRNGDISGWCQVAAEKLRKKTEADLGLLVYKNVAQGGVQIFAALASLHGISVIQRSFGGHPENINQWASTIGLAHLRRWLLVHH